jgi:hypothetical protein
VHNNQLLVSTSLSLTSQASQVALPPVFPFSILQTHALALTFVLGFEYPRCCTGNKSSMQGRRQFVVSNATTNNKSNLMNFIRWNYNCAFYYYYLIMEKIYKINNSNILHSLRMGNLQGLLPNATPLIIRFFGEMSNVSFKATLLMLTLKIVFDFGLRTLQVTIMPE